MADLPESGFRRGVRLASLPAGHAIRAAAGLGKRIGGRPAEIVAAEVQARTAAQLFQVLGELKGGALKLGQAMSAMEALLPAELAEPYRQALTRLQEAAPPLPAHALAESVGSDWRDHREVTASGLLGDDDVGAADLLEVLDPWFEALRAEEFHFDRSWLQREARVWSNPRSTASRLQRKARVPAQHLLVQRVAFGLLGVLTSLDATVPVRAEAEQWIPALAG